jgi:MFS family permease
MTDVVGAAPSPRSTGLPFADRIFPGWIVLAGCFAGYLAYSAHFNTTYGVFIYHLGNEMGWSRSALAGVTTVARLPEVFFAPWIGGFIDRHGGRPIMLVGAGVVSSAFLLLATMQEIWQLYLYKGVLLAIGAMMTSPLLFSVTVNNWFVEKRGRAIGILRTGDTLGTALMPVAVAALIAAGGWRGAFTFMAIAAVALLIPAALLLRRRPEDYGLLPDGRKPGQDAGPEAGAGRRAELIAADVVWTRTAALRSPTLWTIVVAAGLSQMAYVSTYVHLVPYVQELGYPITIAAFAVGARAYIQFFVNPLWGLLVERAPVQLAAASQSVLAATAMLIFFAVASDASLVVGLLLLGISSAGFYLTLDVMWANFFGRVSLGTVRGIAQPFVAAFGAIGPLLAGVLYDVSGGYESTWLVLTFAFASAGAVMLFARRPRPPTPTPNAA